MVPRSSDLRIEDFLKHLNNEGQKTVEIGGLRQHYKTKKLYRVQQQMPAFSNIHIKTYVHDNIITCSPLIKDGKYI